MTITDEPNTVRDGYADEDPGTLKAYVIDGHDVRIRPAPVEREWMEKTDERFAYRCLPLNIANAHGWEILNTVAFSAIWDGSKGKDAIRIRTRQREAQPPAVSHFGHGILTFHVSCLFQTDPGVNLFVSGPINRPKDAVAPLAGIIETDWSPYTFTMNWQMTRPFQRIHFEEGEPFCHVFPVSRGALAKISPEIAALPDNPALQREYLDWTEGRRKFNADLLRPDSAAVDEKWQKSYFRGVNPSGSPGPADHVSRLRLKPFRQK